MPEIGTRERELLEEEALYVGIDSIHDHDGRIADALYAVYSHFRQRFLEERGLMDSDPGNGEVWRDVLTDARVLEDHVAQCWATSIVHSHTLHEAARKRRPI